MATDIPPHNLREVRRRLRAPARGAESQRSRSCGEHVLVPTFRPAAEIITPPRRAAENLRDRQRYVPRPCALRGRDGEIIVTELPVPGVRLEGARAYRGADARQELPMVEDLRDESDHEHPGRAWYYAALEPGGRGQVMAHLFATTDLERSYRVNIDRDRNATGCPAHGDEAAAEEWLAFRVETVPSGSRNRLEKVNARAAHPGGLLARTSNIDEVIASSRYENEPKAAFESRASS